MVTGDLDFSLYVDGERRHVKKANGTKWHGGHADGIAGRGGVWVLGVGFCDGMSRAKHRLGRGITGSDRRDPQTWSYRQHILSTECRKSA